MIRSNLTILVLLSAVLSTWTADLRAANHPDVLTITPDLENPAISVGNPAPGKMVLLPANALAAAVPLELDAGYPGGNARIVGREGDTFTLAPDLRDTKGWWFYFGNGVTSSH